MAAWCRGLRAGHHFTAQPEVEREAARNLAQRAARLNAGDPLAETMLAAGYTLAQDLEAAAVHAERAFELDSGSAWAWGAALGSRLTEVTRGKRSRNSKSLDPLLRLMCSTFTGRSALQQPNFRAHVIGSQLTGTTARLPKIPQARGPNASSRPPMSLRGVSTRVTISLPSSRQLSRFNGYKVTWLLPKVARQDRSHNPRGEAGR
jgi:hypothetical protein